MTHWGWYWKVKRQHTAKCLCDYRTSIDSFALFKTKGVIGFILNKGEKDEVYATVNGIEINVTSDRLSYRIVCEKQSCQFGGFRYFFRCPNLNCNCRMRKLYLFDSMLLCRKCLKMGYRSQIVTPSTRYYLMRKKIEKKLEGFGGSLYRKPKWMRWASFECLTSKERGYERKSNYAIFQELYDRYGEHFINNF